MALPATHPTAEKLFAFTLGQLSEAESLPIEQHLLECEHCRQSAEQSPDDSLIRMLQDHRSTLLPSGTHSLGNPAVSEECLRVLSPARQPGELGWLGGYRVLKILGQGGMGVVFLAEDPQLGRSVALKMMKPSVAALPDARERFLREAQSTAALEHDNIISIFQVGQENGVVFLAMPLLSGTTLEVRLKQGKLTLRDILQIARETADGLSAAHGQGLIHRDIKPSNIWLEHRPAEHEGEPPGFRVKILDFGLARPVEGDSQLTASGMIVGTPEYMSPEQASGQPTDARSDVFSLGCVLYQLIRGVAPFRGQNMMDTFSTLATKPPQPLSDFGDLVPKPFQKLVLQMLAKNPIERPQSIREVSRTTREITENLTGPTPAIFPLVESGETQSVSLGETITVDTPKDLGRTVRKILKPKVLIATALSLATVAFFVLAVILVKWQTPHGTVIVELPENISAEERQSLSIELKGQNSLHILDAKNGWSIEVPEDGPFQIAMKGGSDKFQISRDSITITRGQNEFLKVRYEKSPPANIATTDAVQGDSKAATIPADWKPGPAKNLLPGVVMQPAVFPGIKRWNVIRSAHSGRIQEMEWNPAGNLLAVTDQFSYVRIFRLEDGRLKLFKVILPKSKDEGLRPTGIRGMAWSPNGRWLSVLWDHWGSRFTSLYDTSTFELDREYQMGRISSTCLTWMPDSSELVVGTKNGVQFWNPVTKAEHTIEEPDGVTRVTISPDGKRIAIATGGNVKILDGDGKNLEHSDAIEPAHQTDLKWSSDGRWLVSGGESLWEGPAAHGVIWDAQTWNRRPILTRARIHKSAAWEPGGHRLAVFQGRGFHHLAILRPKDDSILHEIELPDEAKDYTSDPHVAWSSQTRWLCVGYDGTLLLCDLEAGQIVQTIGRRCAVESVAWPVDSHSLWAAITGGDATTWDPTGNPRKITNVYKYCHDSDRNLISVSPVGKRFALRGFWHDRFYTKVFTSDGERIFQFEQRTFPERSKASDAISWSPDGKFLAFPDWVTEGKTGSDPKIRLVNTGDWTSRFLRGIATADVAHIVWDQSGTQLAAATKEKLYVWRIADDELVASTTVSQEIRSLAFSTDGMRVSAQTTNALEILDISSGRLTTVDTARRYWRIGHWSAANQNLVTLNANTGYEIRDASSGLIKREVPESTLVGHRRVYQIEASPDGKRLAKIHGDLAPEYFIPVIDGETLQPLWSGVVVSDNHLASFTAAGQMIAPDPETEQQLHWVVERKEGELELFTREEFLKLATP